MTDMVFTTFSRHDLEHIIDERLRLAFERHGRNKTTTQDVASPPYVSKKEAARLVGVCPSTIDNAARRGQLKRHYIGKSVRFDRGQVMALAKQV